MKTKGLLSSACLLLLFVWPASSQVRLAWSARFAGSTNSMNSPADMAVDPAGNVYVTGSADSTTAQDPNHQDYCTVKFGPDGSLQWAHRYRGGTNGYNVPRRIKLGSDGNLFVVGYSATNHVAFQAQQIATVKYSPNGALLWASRQGIVGENVPYSLAVDSHGSAYITGLGNAAVGPFFLSLKLEPDGQLSWLRTNADPNGYSHGKGIVVDAEANAYVTGASSGPNLTSDLAAIKYGSTGAALWTNSFDSAVGYAIALDGAGNVYVTGSSANGFLTIKYRPDGTSSWMRAIPNADNLRPLLGTHIAFDSDGKVIVAGQMSHPTERRNWGIVKYDPAGTELWSRQYNRPGFSDDDVKGLVVDSQGAIYVTGVTVTNFQGYSVAVTAKYSSDGTELWRTEYAGTARPLPKDSPVGLGLDAAGNVYVAARTLGPAGDDDYLVLKYEQASPGGRFVSISPDAEGRMSLLLFGTAGTDYAFERSEDLREWTVWTNLFNPSGLLQVVDPTANTAESRFYRVRPAP